MTIEFDFDHEIKGLQEQLDGIDKQHSFLINELEKNNEMFSSIIASKPKVAELFLMVDPHDCQKLFVFIDTTIITLINDPEMATIGVIFDEDDSETYPNFEGYEPVTKEFAQKFLAGCTDNMIQNWGKLYKAVSFINS
jgi:hypothetical protein